MERKEKKGRRRRIIKKLERRRYGRELTSAPVNRRSDVSRERPFVYIYIPLILCSLRNIRDSRQ